MTDPRNVEPDQSQRPPPSQPTPPAADEPQANGVQPDADTDATVGTGTSIALGCIAGTVLLVIIGLVFLLVLLALS